MKSNIITVRDARLEKLFREALEDQRNSARVKIERDRQAYVTARLREYPQIGTLNSGKFYAFIGGYGLENYFESEFLSQVIDAINSAR